MLSKRGIIRLFLLAVMFITYSCSSVDRYNADIPTKRGVNELKSDVNYIQRKLEKLHPDLYHYISKAQLDAKFDSLSASITEPMTSNEFFFKLSPVVASIKQGHTQTYPLIRRYNKKERIAINKRGTTPLALYDFELFDNILYIVKKYANDSTIKLGTQLLSVNDIPTKDLISKYRNTLTSDGDNTTFITRRLAKSIPLFYYFEFGAKDSLTCQVSYKDTIRTVVLRFPAHKKPTNIRKTKEQLAKEKSEQRAEAKKRNLQGYDSFKHLYSKQVSFPLKDSSVALMKITDFNKGNYRKFYKQTFEKLNSVHTKSLIIDLRDNGGGRIRDTYALYSYLADTSFVFVNKSEVASKTSLWHRDIYEKKSPETLVAKVCSLPFVVLADIHFFIKTKKGDDGKYRYSLTEGKKSKPKSPTFKGKVYVLINGGSFSASSLISTNLKGKNRATFVGEETGGAYNGCVAGIMPIRVLPASKLKIRFGLLVCDATPKTLPDGRGIFPDKTIIPTLADRLNDTDPELQWILDDIKGNNLSK